MIHSTEPWLGKCPTEWIRSRIRNVITLSPGYSGIPPKPDDECTVVPMEFLYDDGTLDVTNKLLFEDIQSGLTQFEKGDVLFAKITPCMENGKGCFVANLPTHYGFGSTEFHVLRPTSRILGKFLYYATFNPVFRDYAADNMTGAAGQKRVSSRFLKDTRLFLPSLQEQKIIAAYLDASCVAIDAAVAAKRRQLETLNRLRDSALHHVFSNSSWLVERVKDVSVRIGSGVTPDGGAASYLDNGIPLLRSQNIHFDGLRLDDVAFISEETHYEMSGSQLKPRDVLLNITGASIGRCTFIPENFGQGNVNQHVCFIRVNHKLDYRFLSLFLSSPLGQSQVFSSFTGASRQGLSHKELGLIRVPLPPLAIQHAIVNKIEQDNTNQKQVRKGIEAQIATLMAYRNSLIHECVTGQRRITETDLNHIKAHDSEN